MEKNHDERINLLETNINSATDLCTNRAEDAIDTGCSVISKNFSSYFFEWERNMFQFMFNCSKNYCDIDDRVR